MTARVACVQFAPTKARVSENLDRIAEATRLAASERAVMAVFPETAVSGYFLEGGVGECALTAEALASELGRRMAGLTQEIQVLTGFYELSGDNLYNSAAVVALGPGGSRLISVYRKFFLPTYGVFDEERFVSRGTEIGLFESAFGPAAILICEDVWHSILPTICALRGARVIFVPSASPGRGFGGDEIGNLDRYRRMLRSLTEEHGVFAVNSQLCGFEGGKGFVGGSSVFDPYGRMIAASPSIDEHVLIAEMDTDLIALARAQAPLISDLRSAWQDVRRQIDAID